MLLNWTLTLTKPSHIFKINWIACHLQSNHGRAPMTEADAINEPEETLDPPDWEALARAGHRMLNDVLRDLRTVRERPPWRPAPPAVRARFRCPVPIEPEGLDAVYADFQRDVAPYPLGNIHPRFWAWVCGTGTASGVLAEMLTAGMNSSLFGADIAAIHVEEQVLDWCKSLMGFPPEASGILVSGGSMANLVGLTVARNARAGADLSRRGLQALPRRMTLYSSRETHSSVRKAVELLGLGSESLRLINTDPDFRIDVSELAATVREDRALGHQPFCVVGNAGTVNTGATDDLEALASFCQAEGLWFHVDGAFGALAALSPRFSSLLRGMDRADSLAFDFHKWMYVPYEAGCVLVRRREEHRSAFSYDASYLTRATKGLPSGSTWFSEYGPQLSRGFRALKVWMTLKEHGVAKFRRLIEQNVDQVKYLEGLVAKEKDLELTAPAPLNVLCFRYVGDAAAPGAGRTDFNALNNEIVLELQERGLAVPSVTTVNGKVSIRVANTNHRTRREDLLALVIDVVRLGRELGPAFPSTSTKARQGR